MSKILITGAAGFLGRNLTDYLQNTCELILTDQHPDKWTHQQLEPRNSTKITYADIDTDHAVLGNLLEGVDVVIHCANKARIDPSWLTYSEYYLTNITSTHRFFELCQAKKVKKFIYISSSSVYGNNGQTIQTEDGPLVPSSPYAVSKLGAEWALRVQSQKAWITELIIVRPFTMYGKYMDYSAKALMIPKFFKCYVDGDPLLLHGNGEQTRDFLCASDAVVGIGLLIEHGERDRVYNLGSGTSTGIKQIADAISLNQIKVSDRIGQVQSTLADISKLRALGFDPKTDVVEWATAQIANFNQSKGK